MYYVYQDYDLKKYFWPVVELNELFCVDYEYKLHFEKFLKNLLHKTENEIDKKNDFRHYVTNY